MPLFACRRCCVCRGAWLVSLQRACRRRPSFVLQSEIWGTALASFQYFRKTRSAWTLKWLTVQLEFTGFWSSTILVAAVPQVVNWALPIWRFSPCWVYESELLKVTKIIKNNEMQTILTSRTVGQRSYEWEGWRGRRNIPRWHDRRRNETLGYLV